MGGKERFLSLTADEMGDGSPMHDGAGSLRRRMALLLATNGALRRSVATPQCGRTTQREDDHDHSFRARVPLPPRRNAVFAACATSKALGFGPVVVERAGSSICG